MTRRMKGNALKGQVRMNKILYIEINFYQSMVLIGHYNLIDAFKCTKVMNLIYFMLYEFNITCISLHLIHVN